MKTLRKILSPSTMWFIAGAQMAPLFNKCIESLEANLLDQTLMWAGATLFCIILVGISVQLIHPDSDP